MPSSRHLMLLVVLLTASVYLPAQNASPKFALLPCTPLPVPTGMNGAAVVGKRLYVMGGRQQKWGWTRKVLYADIKPDGRLSDWKEERPLPEFRAYIGNSVEVVNDRIYVVAGSIPENERVPESQSKYANDVLWTKVQPDGSLSDWKRSIPYPGDPVTRAATCSSDKQLFILGGRTKNIGSDRILVAEFGPDGAPANWREERKLPVPLWFLQAALLEDRIYVWGGLTVDDSTKPTAEAYSATVARDGRIGEWQKEKPMPKPFFSSVFCGFNDYLVAAGGQYPGGIPCLEIWYNHMQNGRLAEWTALNTDLEPAASRSLGFDKARGVVYVIGGMRRDMTGQGPGTGLNTVQAFQLPQPNAAKLTATSQSSQSGAFTSLPAATQRGSQTGKQVMALFYSPQVPSCKRFWDNVVSTPAFADLTRPYLFAAVDITTMDPKEFQQIGVYKVPALVLFGPDGKVIARTLGPRTFDDVKALPLGGQ